MLLWRVKVAIFLLNFLNLLNPMDMPTRPTIVAERVPTIVAERVHAFGSLVVFNLAFGIPRNPNCRYILLPCCLQSGFFG